MPLTSDELGKGNYRRIDELEAKVAQLEEENRRLRTQARQSFLGATTLTSLAPLEYVNELSRDHIERYSRQLLLSDGFGVQGQKRLLNSSVLVVGAGGIGSTVLLYLGAAGVGRISIVDFDDIEIANLHRQVIHKSTDVGLNKALSATRAVLDLNPTIQCDALPVMLIHDNALDIIQQYDCIVDASDNARTRYLINDACVLAQKPLVSGSAVGTEGQLTVYNWRGGPCYRCLYPHASASAACHSCSDAGVLGPVPGMIGILQSMEVIKILTGVGRTMHDRLLMYDALQSTFLTIKKPPPLEKCPICGPWATIRSMEDSQRNLQQARGPGNVILPPDESTLPNGCVVSVQSYQQVRNQGIPHVLLDVRVPQQFAICALEGAVNVALQSLPHELHRIEELSNSEKPVYCICRRGIASAEAAHLLHESRPQHPRIHSVFHVHGGLTAWHSEVDANFPKY